MNFKIILYLFLLFLASCVQKSNEINFKDNYKHYSNKGFTLIFDDTLLKKKIVDNKIDERSLIVFNKNLKEDTVVKITNLLNGKELIAKVGIQSNYPLFYNSVISQRIATDLELNATEPYIAIQSLSSSSTFIANKAKTYKEEETVADKAPIESITIKNISISRSSEVKKKTKKQHKFNYIIKFADLYFKNSAIMLQKRLKDEFNLNNVFIKKITENSYRVYKGPFKNLESIKKEFMIINKLNFENIEIIKTL